MPLQYSSLPKPPNVLSKFNLVLGSRSPRRQQLLSEWGIQHFQTFDPFIAESSSPYFSGGELVALNSRRKARATATLLQKNTDPKSSPIRPSLVLAADTLVILDGHIFGKPADLTEASDMMRKLSGRTHQVLSGVCLVLLNGEKTPPTRTKAKAVTCSTLRPNHFVTIEFVERTDVTFRKLSAAAIREYHRLIDPLDKAGAYAAQDFGDTIIEGVSGSWTNVMGLPMERLFQIFDEKLPALLQD